MLATRPFLRRAGPRDLLYFTRPELWPWHPFLPVKRYPAKKPPEYGVMYDAVHASGTYGYSSTVFVCNLFARPRNEAKFLALPRHVYN